MSTPTRPPYSKPILVVDDDPGMLATLSDFLGIEGYRVQRIQNPLHAAQAVKDQGIEIVVMDINMPHLDGVGLLKQLKAIDPELVCILMTGYGSEKVAVEAMKAGAYDYLSKPFEMDSFLVTIRNAVERILLLRQNHYLAERLRQQVGVREMVGTSRKLEDIRDTVRRVAPSDVTVLITGESGTGKELVAQSIVDHSRRPHAPFVRINCAAIPENLLESELFGHEKGAFTGAVSRQIGKFEMADGGTLFLDEIGDMSLSTQTKVLRVIQGQSFERIGGKETLQTDVRLVAATNKDLMAEIRKGTFREDLYYRLNVIEIRIPPLRERREDIPLLVEHFMVDFSKKYGRDLVKPPPEVLARLCAYTWPGNIRQLRNYVERITVLGLTASDLERDVDAFTRPHSAGLVASQSEEGAVPESLEDVETRHIRRIMAMAKGNRAHAARILRIDPKTLRAKLKRLPGSEGKEWS